MMNTFNSPPNFDNYLPESENTQNVMKYFLGNNGGPSFLDMSLNWVNIETPVEDFIMSYGQTSYYEILNLKYD